MGASSFFGADLRLADSTTNATVNDVVYKGTLTLTGDAAKEGYVGHFTGSTSSNTADNLYGNYVSLSNTGTLATGTKNLFGTYNAIADGSLATGGLVNLYGGYFHPANTVTQFGAVTSTNQSLYGIYTDPIKSGADNATYTGTQLTYGIYSNSQNTSTGGDATNAIRTTLGGYFAATGAAAGTTTAYGIYSTASGADTNYPLFLATTQPASVSTTPGTAADNLIGISAATGGNTTNASGTGGVGSGLSWTFGAGGTSTGATAPTGGAGGAFAVTTGAGGAPAVAAATNLGGNGGAVTLITGAGGAASGGTTAINTGGNGGTLTLTAGNGGAASGGSGTQTGGAGGNISITAGNAGTGTNANGGTLTLNSGAVTGTGTSTINLGSANTTNLNIGTASVADTITIGNNTSTTSLALTSGTGSQTFTSSVVSGTTTTSAQVFADNSITSGTGAYFTSSSLQTGKLVDINTGSANTLTTGTLLNIASTSTAGTASTSDYLANLSRSGANAGASHLAYGLASSVTNTGTTNTNYALFATASGATTNYALYTTAGNIKNILGVTDFVTLDNTTAIGTNSTTATGTLYVNSKSLTSGNTGASFNYLSTNSTATATQYGIYSNFSNASACVCTSTTDVYYGQYGITTKSGADNLTTAGTTTVYGIYQDAQNSSTDVGSFTTSARNTFGGYFSATGAAAGTTTAYGIYSTATGADTNYGIYTTAPAGVTTNVGIYTSGAGYGIYSTGGSGHSDYFQSTSSTVTAGVINIDISVNTPTDHRGIDLNYSIEPRTANDYTNYGIYSLFTDTNGASLSANTQTYYGIYSGLSKTGADSPGTSSSFTSYGIYSAASNTSGSDVGTLTRNTFGGVFSAEGNANSSSTAYGIYATGTGADTNYGAILYGQTTSTNGDTVYGAYNITASTGAISGVTRTLIGTYGVSTATNAANAASTISNVYGGIFNAVGENAGATMVGNSYGVYAAASGGDNNYGAYINTTGTTNGNTGIYDNFSFSATALNHRGFGMQIVNTHTNSGSNSTILYGLYTTITNTANEAARDMGVAAEFTIAGDTLGTKEAYGIYSNITNSNSTTDQGTRNTYGGIFQATGSSFGTSATYGIYTRAQSADNNYGVYSTVPDSTTNAVTNYGIYNSVASTGNAAKILFGQYSNITSSSTTADTLYGGYFKTGATGNVARTANYGSISYGQTTSTTGDTVYGAYNATVATGAINGTTRTLVGTYGVSTSTGATAGASTVTNAYGGFFSAVSETGGTTGNSYGVYAMAASGDTNYPFYMGSAPVSSGTAALCWDGTGESPINDCSGTPVADYAEIYPTETGSAYGEIVVLGPETVETQYTPINKDSNPEPETVYNIQKLIRSSAPYQSNIIGIISNNWGDFTSTGHGSIADQDNPKPVALSGRVPVKVIDENGPIMPGDLLTTSSTPGHAMKADPTKGSTFAKALETFDGPGSGEIMVFVESNTRYNLASALQNTNLQALSFATSTGNTTIDALGNITTAGNIVANGSLSAAGGQFTVDGLGNVQTTGSISAASLNILGDATIAGNLTVNGELKTNNLTALAGSDLNISLGDSIGSNSLRIMDSINNQLLALTSAGRLSLDVAGGSFNIPAGYICVNDSGTCDVANPQNGTVYADNFSTTGTADLAEHFPTADASIADGDIVAVDPNNKENLIKSSKTYQETLLGIVSTAPGISLNSTQVNGKPLALAGRVPTKVNLENGEIKAGDPITSSNTPGVGMKATQAGRVIGIALEDLPSTINQRPQPEAGRPLDETITVFVNPSWYTGQSLAQNGSFTGSTERTGNTDFTDSPTHRLTDSTNSDGTLASNKQQATSNKLTEAEIEELVRSEVKRQVGELLASSQIQGASTSTGVDSPIPTSTDNTNLTDNTDFTDSPTHRFTDSPGSTPSAESSASASIASGAQIAKETDDTLAKLSELLSTVDLKLSTLTVTSDSQLAQTQVAGTFSQDGTFIIDYGRQINVLGNTLFLQNDAFAGNCELSTVNCQLLDVGNSKLTFDKGGNLTITGTLVANNVQTKEITVDTTDENAKSAGTATLAIGKNQVTIFTTLVKPNAKILITPTTPTGGKQLYVATKSEFEGFTVALDGTYAANKIEFDWLIVNTNAVSQAN
ncbi:MAG: hypothetical protein AAB512_03685 [Patescibacteria group bacterium]